MDQTQSDRKSRTAPGADLCELEYSNEALPRGWCREYRISVRAEVGPEDQTGSAIVRVFETTSGRVVLLTQPEKASYGGPPLPTIVAMVVPQVARIEAPDADLEDVRWIAHFNRASYFEEANVLFEPEFCDVLIKRAEDDTIAEIAVARRVSPEQVGRLLHLPLPVVYRI